MRSIDLRSGIARPLLSGLKNAVAIDFLISDSSEEPGSDSVFWADVQDDKIYRGNLIGKAITNVQTVVENGVVGVEGLAVDWIGENLYWIVSDWDQGRVQQSHLSSQFAFPCFDLAQLLNTRRKMYHFISICI